MTLSESTLLDLAAHPRVSGPLLAMAAWVEASRGADRELDAAVWCLIEHPHQSPQRNFFYTEREEWGFFTTNQPNPGLTFHDAPALTASLDAVIALLERVLPGWEWTVRTNAGRFSGNVWSHEIQWECSSGGSSPARSLLASLLKAMVENQR